MHAVSLKQVNKILKKIICIKYLWNVAKAILRRKFMGRSAYVGEGRGVRKAENKDLINHFKKLKT